MTDDPAAHLVFDVDLNAPPEAVWRAIREGEFRRRWLPDDALADPVPIETVPGREVIYRMREDLPPFAESVVAFRIEPDGAGGTRLRIAHGLTDRAVRRLGPAANGNDAPVCRAA